MSNIRLHSLPTLLHVVLPRLTSPAPPARAVSGLLRQNLHLSSSNHHHHNHCPCHCSGHAVIQGRVYLQDCKIPSNIFKLKKIKPANTYFMVIGSLGIIHELSETFFACFDNPILIPYQHLALNTPLKSYHLCVSLPHLLFDILK